MATKNYLYKREIPINSSISIVIPTVGEIVDSEDEYYGVVSAITAMPIDMMCQLDDIGIDFTTINEYELFLYMFNVIKNMDTSLIFGSLDLSKFVLDKSEQNGNYILVNKKKNIVIDRAIHSRIADVLREIHHIEKNTKKPANKEAKEFMIERARAKSKRRKNIQESSQIESLIIAMVNTEQYKYDFDGTRELSIYQFNESVRQIINKVDYDNIMHGIYAGTIDAKDLSQDDLNWLTHK